MSNLEEFFTYPDETNPTREEFKKFILNNLIDKNNNISSRKISYHKSFILNSLVILQNLKPSNILEGIYWAVYNVKDYPKCIICNNSVKFRNYKLGYRKTCSNKCSMETPNRQEKRKATCLLKYGVDHNMKSNICLDKRKLTYIENYGVDSPLKNIDILEKNQKYRWKQYTLPSGNIINIQGYENFALDELLKIYTENEIITSRKDIPEVWYNVHDQAPHRYFPDIWIPKDNLIIEVKSEWTMKKYYNINKLKEQATKDLGYNFKYMIFKKNRELVN